MNQPISFGRGTLDSTRIRLSGTPARTRGWDYDAVGNFDSVTTDSTVRSCTADAQTEITSIGGQTTPTYNGTGRQFLLDAWNRPVAVENSGDTTFKVDPYDGLNRRVTETVAGRPPMGRRTSGCGLSGRPNGT